MLRNYWRQRQGLIASCAQQIHLLHKALDQMNVQVHKVLSDITGQSGMRIVRAIVAGERDREKLASLCHSGIKCTQAQVARALEGNYRAEHVFALGQALEAHDFFQHQLEAADRALEAQIATVPSRHTSREKRGLKRRLVPSVARTSPISICASSCVALPEGPTVSRASMP